MSGHPRMPVSGDRLGAQSPAESSDSALNSAEKRRSLTGAPDEFTDARRGYERSIRNRRIGRRHRWQGDAARLSAFR